MPTFLVLSGTVLHIYYVFQEPIDLYPNIKIQLKSLKYDLTFRMWDYQGTSQVKGIQYQSINQGFRMVGSVNEKYGTRLVAFRIGERVTLDDLNAYAEPENRVDLRKPFNPSKMTRAEAKEAYPEWYERVVVQGDNRKRQWDIAGKVHGEDPYALYHWWQRQVRKVEGGHRYFYMMCLAIYAYKCGVPKKQLKKDMQRAFEELRLVKHVNPLTEDDITSAMEAYDKEYYNFTIADIEALTAVRIERNKRNGRKMADHIRLMNFVRDEINGNTDWRNKDGAPSKQGTVMVWRVRHPKGSKAECKRDTGLSYPTIRKWWDAEYKSAPQDEETRKKRNEEFLRKLYQRYEEEMKEKNPK